MQIFTHIAKVCSNHIKNTSGEWTVQQCVVRDSYYHRVHNHRFEIYTLVSEIHENVDLVLGIKNVFKLEGVINLRDCRFEFLNRSVPIYPEKEVILKPDEKRLVKVKAPFVDKISG